jgi:hypothetical protein
MGYWRAVYFVEVVFVACLKQDLFASPIFPFQARRRLLGHSHACEPYSLLPLSTPLLAPLLLCIIYVYVYPSFSESSVWNAHGHADGCAHECFAAVHERGRVALHPFHSSFHPFHPLLSSSTYQEADFFYSVLCLSI